MPYIIYLLHSVILYYRTVPKIYWALPDTIVTDGLTIHIEGIQMSTTDVLLINDISIVAT